MPINPGRYSGGRCRCSKIQPCAKPSTRGDVWSPASTSSCRRLSPMSWPVRFARATSGPCYVAGWGVRTATSGSTPADICSTRRARIISSRPIGKPAWCAPKRACRSTLCSASACRAAGSFRSVRGPSSSPSGARSPTTSTARTTRAPEQSAATCAASGSPARPARCSNYPPTPRCLPRPSADSASPG